MITRNNSLIVYSRGYRCAMGRKQFIINLLPRTASQADNFADRYRQVRWQPAPGHRRGLRPSRRRGALYLHLCERLGKGNEAR